MACIEHIYSVSALIGSGACNGNCEFCAGKYLRPEVKERHDPHYWRLFESAIRLCARYGGWSLALTSSGEPTCSPREVTKALQVYSNMGSPMPTVNLFTNGILFGSKSFCEAWLPVWRDHGLTHIAVSIHSPFRDRQAKAYGLTDYPEFQQIFDNIRSHGIGARATLLLRKGDVCDASSYDRAVTALKGYGMDNITSWPVGNPDGTRNKFTPARTGLLGIRYWLHRHATLCHGHVWGGGVYDWNGTLLRLTDYVTKHDPNANFVRQLVVFQGSETGGPEVCYSWIRKGALCMK